MLHRPIPLLLAILPLLQTGCGMMRPPGPAPVQRVEVHELARSAQSWNGQTLPPYPAGQPTITMLRITIPPGARLEPHRHPVINAGYLTRGELTVETQTGQTLRLRAGDPIIEVVQTAHYGRNDGRGPAEIVVFYAGVTNAPITIREP